MKAQARHRLSILKTAWKLRGQLRITTENAPAAYPSLAELHREISESFAKHGAHNMIRMRDLCLRRAKL